MREEGGGVTSKILPWDGCAATAAEVGVLRSFGSIIALLEVARLRLFIEGKILCYLIFRATRMETMTSSIYDVISKGKVASTFSYYK